MTRLEQVRLVARREIVMGARGRAFMLGNVAVLVIVVIGLVLMHYFTGGRTSDDRSQVTVGVVDAAAYHQGIEVDRAAADLGVPVVVRSFPDEAAARAAVTAGDVQGVITRVGTAATKVYLSDSAPTVVRSVVTAAVTRRADAPQVQVSTIPVATEGTESTRYAIALAAMILLLLALTIGGSMIASGVAGEKETRIVELLLSTVAPRALLTGKILGIGLLAIGQVILYGGTAFVTALLLGELDVDASGVGVAVVSVAALIVGFFFFASLYAAAGALVARQEDVQSVAFPITALGMVVFYVAVFAGGIEANWVQALAVIPPFSIGLQPFRIAHGHGSLVELVIASIALMAATAGVIVTGARVYERGVLSTGSRLSWREAIRR